MGYMRKSEAQPGSSREPKMESFAKINKDYNKPLLIAAKLSILNVCGGLGYGSESTRISYSVSKQMKRILCPDDAELVLVITCLGDRFGISCLSAYQNCQKSRW